MDYYLLGSLLQGLDSKILSKEINIVVSNEMLKELAAVLARPKFKEIISYKQIKEFFSLIDGYAVIVSPKQKVDVCRDKKDNFLLEVVLEAKAKYLVTGDTDFHAFAYESFDWNKVYNKSLQCQKNNI